MRLGITPVQSSVPFSIGSHQEKLKANVNANRLESYQNYQNVDVSNQLTNLGSGGERVVRWERRKIRLAEGNAKCHHLKKLTCKGTFRQVFICLRPRTLTPPPLYILLHTVYVYSVCILIHTGRGRELNRREG